MEYGITTSVLKGANAPGRSNGTQVGEDATELHTQGTHCESGAIPYDRVELTGQQAVVRSEPADLETSPLVLADHAQPGSHGHSNVTPAYPSPGTGRGAGRNASGTRSR